MVRILLVRHAESKSQARRFTFQERFKRGEFATARERADQEASVRVIEDVNGDPPLSANGREQARLFAEFWAAILQHKARAGKLHIYVSPHMRNLETAEPLIQLFLDKFDLDIHATLLLDLFEIYGIVVHPADRQRLLARMGELGRLSPEGLFPSDLFSEHPEKLPEGFQWTRGGLSTAQMRMRFPWIRVPFGTFGDISDDDPWWPGTPELPDERDQRVSRIVDWLESEADTRGEDEVLLLFVHGEQMGRMLNVLFARAFAGREVLGSSGVVPNRQNGGGRGWVGLDPGSNTSISLLTLVQGGIPRLEFFHRLDHLGPSTVPNTLMRGYQSLGWANCHGDLEDAETDPIGQWGVEGMDVAAGKSAGKSAAARL